LEFIKSKSGDKYDNEESFITKFMVPLNKVHDTYVFGIAEKYLRL
jgi:hypothetical protein